MVSQSQSSPIFFLLSVKTCFLSIPWLPHPSGFLASLLLWFMKQLVNSIIVHKVLGRVCVDNGFSKACTVTPVSCSTSLLGVEPAGDFRQIPDDQYQSGPLEYTYIKKIYLQSYSRIGPCSYHPGNIWTCSLCLNTLAMRVYFIGWVRNVRTRLSYKQHLRTVFVFLLLFAMWNVLTNALMLFFL